MQAGIATLGQGWGSPGLTVALASACYEAGLYDEALSATDRILAIIEQGQQARFFEAELHRLRGVSILAKAEPASLESGEKSLRMAIEVARARQFRSWELRASVDLARLWQQQGRVTEARELLTGVYDWFTEGFDTPDLRDARALLEELASANTVRPSP
jgi:predicted ATPase